MEDLVHDITLISKHLTNNKYQFPPEIIKEHINEMGQEKVLSLLGAFIDGNKEGYEFNQFKEFMEKMHDAVIQKALWELFKKGEIEANVDPKTNEWVYWKKQ
jgi:DNA-binding HxlR family transcriptional regulator